MRAPQWFRDLPVAPAVFVLGFGFSLAANLLWTWPGGPVRILGGALASIALPAAIHLWPQVQAPEWWSKVLRNLVMLWIAGLAAFTTFSHATALLMANGETVWLSRAYPVMTELLVVFAVLASRSPRKARSRDVKATKPAAKPAVKEAAPKPARSLEPTAPDEVQSRRGERTDRAAWLRDQPAMTWSEQVAAVEQKFSVSRSTAKRVVSQVAS